jgi:hypothetical protein
MAPDFPLRTIFSRFRERNQRRLVGAADVLARKDVGAAVSHLPITHSGDADIDRKGNACRKYADQSNGNPSLARIERGQDSVSKSRSSMNCSSTKRIFDL